MRIFISSVAQFSEFSAQRDDPDEQRQIFQMEWAERSVVEDHSQTDSRQGNDGS
jgi:hypothetical protein